MNEEAGSAPELEIIEKIFADAEAQARKTLENARSIADAENKKTEKEAQEIQAQILAEAEVRVKKLQSKEISTARIEAKRILLRAREEAVSKVFTQIEIELNKVREDPGRYRQSLRNLAAEAVVAIGEPEVVLKVNKLDEPFVNNAFVDDLRSRVLDLSGEDLKVTLEFEALDMGGGCVAASTKGRIVFDNTFRRRLERMQPQLRTLIIRELAKSDE
jgi:vacuolar-type H+-ATPase subunit E/Vma4